MKKTRVTGAIAAAVTAIIAVLVAEVLLVPPTKQAVFIAPSGNFGAGAALFYVTNAESRAIFLARLEVQSRASDGWKTVSKKTSTILERSGPKTYEWSGKLAAGQYRAVYVEPPTNGPWRISMTYLREVGELRSRLAKILHGGGVTGFDTAHPQVLSAEITQ